MKNLKKTIAAGLAMAMALSANVGVFAANEFTASYNEALTEIAVDNITTNENFNAGEQYTVIIGEKSAMAAGSIADASILYINQGTTSEEFWGEMATKTTLEVGKTYTVRIGGENLSTVYEFDVEITSDGIEVQLGDANQVGGVESLDLIAVLKHLSNTEPLTGINEFAANANQVGGVESLDLIAILKHLASTELLGKAVYVAD